MSWALPRANASASGAAEVHGDVTALLKAGVLVRTADRRVEFPFEVVRVEFVLRAA